MFERRPGYIVFPSLNTSPSHRFLLLKSLLNRKEFLTRNSHEDRAIHWVSRRITEIFESLKIQESERETLSIRLSRLQPEGINKIVEMYHK